MFNLKAIGKVASFDRSQNCFPERPIYQMQVSFYGLIPKEESLFFFGAFTSHLRFVTETECSHCTSHPHNHES